MIRRIGALLDDDVGYTNFVIAKSGDGYSVQSLDKTTRMDMYLVSPYLM